MDRRSGRRQARPRAGALPPADGHPGARRAPGRCRTARRPAAPESAATSLSCWKATAFDVRSRTQPAERAGRPRRVPCPLVAPIPVNIAAHVGNTPMVRLTRLVPADLDVELYGKLEAFNPGGSVKDRIGVAMLEAAERDGLIEPGRTTIVEATSGNTGIALAFCCAAKGYDLTIFLPQGMSREREALLRLYGARVEMVESLGGMNEAVDAARAMARDPDVFLPAQFSNPANPEAHRTGTGPEILDALDGKVDVFVAGVGTGGTITGVGEALKARNPKAQVIAVEPQSSAVLSGGGPGPHRIPGIGAGFVPAVLDTEILDEVIA